MKSLSIAFCIIIMFFPKKVENFVNFDILPPKECKGTLNPLYTYLDNVEVTMYHPVVEQTDDTPDQVADGTYFDIFNASPLKWIAVSRDLHSRYGGTLKFGDIIYIKIPYSNKSGFYLVKDLMNKRFTKKIDILESIGHEIYKYPSAQLYFVSHSKFPTELIWDVVQEDNKIIAP